MLKNQYKIVWSKKIPPPHRTNKRQGDNISMKKKGMDRQWEKWGWIKRKEDRKYRQRGEGEGSTKRNRDINRQRGEERIDRVKWYRQIDRLAKGVNRHRVIGGYTRAVVLNEQEEILYIVFNHLPWIKFKNLCWFPLYVFLSLWYKQYGRGELISA